MKGSDYYDQQRIITDKQVFDTTVIRQSEFKKPYLEDDYPTMEYKWPDPHPPPIPPQPPGPNPWPNPVDPPEPINDVCHCSPSLCYCKGKKRCGSLGCNWPVSGVKTDSFDWGDGTATLEGSQICFSAADGASGTVRIDVSMKVTRRVGNKSIAWNCKYEFSIEECSEKTCKEDQCGGESIGYTTQQMSCSGVQNLSVIGGHPGSVYTWEVSGGGSITSEGVYTAPATNANCASNAVIHLLCNEATVATLNIAINCVLGEGAAYYGPGACLPSSCSVTATDDCSGSYRLCQVTCSGHDYSIDYNCDGTSRGTNIWRDRCSSSSSAFGCLSNYALWCENIGIPYCQGFGKWEVCNPATCGYTDVRTAQQKTDGCCPATLL